jgi:hypothetical protein
MSEAFIPLVPVTAESHETTFTSLYAKQLVAAPPAPVPTGAHSEPCSEPTITLQRNGEVISGIRIQCKCGQVIELSCVY